MKYLLALLAVAGIWVSVLALRVHNQAPGEAPPCAVTEKFDCGAVNHSRFAVFPPRTFDEAPNSKGHIPVAVIGIVGYAIMALLALLGRYGLLLLLAEVGCLMAGFLSYLEAYVLEKWCIYCLWSQCIMATLLLLTGVTMLIQRNRRRHSGGAR
ncbi:vitamin K epoxide reductase family protein [Granulicella arctica]|uniref:Putative membrane protein n=1 Tax=Granulicella arctica TaxID=940613 RepID=A0A7Y9PK40_9BACT|nr:vitamin K epoxide reductase family protein [Granulicella arctica]NYF81379.1 putative membrane protein [Granulicella arctica]